MKRGLQVFRWLLVFLLVFSVSGLPTATAKQPEGKGNSSHKGGGKANKHGGKDDGVDIGDIAGGALVSAGISALQAKGIARDLGLVNYGALPPGIQKNLARGKPLPPGIAKKMVPGGMLSRLPVHPGYEWRIAGRDLILVGAATSVIADVLKDVFD